MNAVKLEILHNCVQCNHFLKPGHDRLDKVPILCQPTAYIFFHSSTDLLDYLNAEIFSAVQYYMHIQRSKLFRLY